MSGGQALTPHQLLASVVVDASTRSLNPSPSESAVSQPSQLPLLLASGTFGGVATYITMIPMASTIGKPDVLLYCVCSRITSPGQMIDMRALMVQGVMSWMW